MRLWKLSLCFLWNLTWGAGIASGARDSSITKFQDFESVLDFELLGRSWELSELHSIDVEGRDSRTLASFELCGQKNGPAIMVSPEPQT